MYSDIRKNFNNLIFCHIEHEDLVENEMWLDNIYVKRFVNPKFLQDKLFFNNSAIFVCTDGTLLNAKDLKEEYSAHNNEELVRLMYEKFGVHFISKLRGDFSGVIYDKSEKMLKIFTNHVGSKPIYYFWDKPSKSLIFCSELKFVLNFMRYFDFPTKLSEIGAYSLLSFGYMLRDYTLCQNVKKLLPGTILTFDPNNGVISMDNYFQLKNTPYIEEKKDTIINELDCRFCEAIQKEYDKDIEYGYRHITTLSGGLDSRMNLIKGKMLGYNDILAITFSQSNYLDEKIAKKITSDHGCSFLFYALDNGIFLKDIEKPVLANDGQIFFANAAHVLAIVSLINWKEYGLLHTGQIGDLVLGSYLYKRQHFKVSDKVISKTAYSNKLINRIPKQIFEEIQQNYESDEIFAFYERCVNGIFNGYLMIQQHSEFASPFLYLDFLEYSLRIHPRLRYREKIYHDWIQMKVPDAAQYIWEKTGLPINAGEWRVILKKAFRYAKQRLIGPSSSDSMNPFDYWYKTNGELRNIFNDYYENHISLLDNYPSIKADGQYLFEQGNTLEKCQILSLISAIKLFGLT